MNGRDVLPARGLVLGRTGASRGRPDVLTRDEASISFFDNALGVWMGMGQDALAGGADPGHLGLSKSRDPRAPAFLE